MRSSRATARAERDALPDQLAEAQETIASLRRDLETARARVVELESLVAELEGAAEGAETDSHPKKRAAKSAKRSTE